MHPREFGRYRILKLLPKGGMGVVYLAENIDTGQPVALKLIEQGSDADRVEIAEAERRGALLQEQLCRRDKRIAQLRSFGEHAGFFYIEMEYVEGHDLSELLDSQPLGIPFAARIGVDLCEVLAEAHTLAVTIEGHAYRGVVHGDIKPRNIRITPHGEVRVLDFGIAKALSLTRSYTQIRFGSSQYSSPERLQSGEVNIASDLWAVAVVLYEIVTAHPYFEAESGPKLEILIRNYRSVRPMPGNLPQPFAAILRKALHPFPEARYATAEEFAADLKAFLHGKPTVAASLPDDEELERTRRTSVPLAEEADEGATRRTVPPAAARPVTAFPVRRSFGSAPFSPKIRRYLFAGVLAALIVVTSVIWHEVSVWRKGDELVRELQTERLTDLDAAWTRYQALTEQSHVPLLLHTPKRTILDRLTATADQAIEEFRDSEGTVVSEGQWSRARAALSRALQLASGDEEIRGKLYLCDAHLARIRGSRPFSPRLLNESRSKFEQARELLPKSPDPYLGLARLYVYSLKDVDRAEDALKAASKRGHRQGRREKAQLADGYRDRAERILKEADKATGKPEEKDYLERAHSDFKRAANLYGDIAPYAGATTNLRKVLEQTEGVDGRLKAIQGGT